MESVEWNVYLQIKLEQSIPSLLQKSSNKKIFFLLGKRERNTSYSKINYTTKIWACVMICMYINYTYTTLNVTLYYWIVECDFCKKNCFGCQNLRNWFFFSKSPQIMEYLFVNIKFNSLSFDFKECHFIITHFRRRQSCANLKISTKTVNKYKTCFVIFQSNFHIAQSIVQK